jgi:hypothetical protein
MKFMLGIVSILFFVNSIHAEDSSPEQWKYYPSIGLVWNQINFARPKGELNANYKNINIGVTAAREDYYVNFQGEFFGKSNFKNGTEFTSVEREDQTLTIGKVIDRANIFIGYTKAETKDDFLGEFHFDEGVFIGTGYDFVVGESRIGLSLGYANLNGEIFSDGVGLLESGKTQGLSYRIGVSGPFRKDMGYKVFVRYRSYEFRSGGIVTDKKVFSVGAEIVF